ncbi:hypothetical protein [Robiginitalea sp. SC105]|uniref:hypothetical protein n=1 Tax=Robiginitalea sp. SC105 TaxID=2762332 RepID=UPI00163B348C|nr:hypothetical protein [Robiginitalea sp. SC105]MBC2838348.1 hypothetical protein [Robiginitalea sp. SC105]
MILNKKWIAYLSLTVILCGSCTEEKRAVREIDFTTNYKLSSEIEEWVQNDTTAWRYQISAVDYATKGDYKNALRHWDLAMESRELNYSQSKIDSINNLYQKVPARDYILERAENEQIIIINEAHHSSFHRFFTKSLLKDLFDLGYKNLGLEALANGADKDSLLSERKHPIPSTGLYISEPQFGNLVRDALEIGYHVFPYEQTSGVNNTEREIEQARYIEEVVRNKPGEKFLIHCGFDHAYEGKHDWWGKAMAEQLKEYTNIDPLTINQTLYDDKGDPKFRHPFAKAVDAKESVVLLDEAGNPFQAKSGEAYTDLTIFHPATEYVNNRPGWLFDQGNLKGEIELEEFKSMFPVLVMAFREGEDINQAVPVDISEVQNEQGKAILALPKGVYTIVVTDKNQSFEFKKEVN